MSAEQLATCALGIMPATLSAWHDRMVSPTEAERLQSHLPTCAACQATLAEFAAIDAALRDAPMPNRQAASFTQESLWRGIRPVVHQQIGAQDMRLSRRVTWSGVGVIAAAVIAVVLFGLIANKTASGVKPATTTTSNSTPYTVTQAWGTNYATRLPMGQTTGDASSVDATNIFIPTDIAPDGSFLVGYETAKDGSLNVMALTVATGKTQQLAQYPSLNGGSMNVGMIYTDGNFAVWLTSVTNDATFAEQDQVVTFDLHTMQSKTIISTTNNGPYDTQSVLSYALYQGVVYFANSSATTSVFQAIDLRSGKTQQLLSGVGRVSFTQLKLSYPYLLYQGNDKTYHVYNLQTGSNAVLPSDPLGRTSADWAISGTTVYALITSVDQNTVIRKVLQLPHADQPGAQWQDAATYPFIATGINAALDGVSDRVFVLIKGPGPGAPPLSALEAWDRTEHHLVALAPRLMQGYFPNLPIVRGQWLVWEDVGATFNVTVNVVNTATLPTKPAQ